MAAFHLNGDLFSDLGLFFLPDDETEALQECAHDFQPVLPEQQESSNAVPPSTGHAEESQLVSIKQEEFSQTVPAETHLDRVREFFEYSLPPFVKHRHHSTSKSTRPPARFDRHLDDHLRLKRIIYQPSLVADLEAIADQALEDYTSVRPLPSTDAAVGRSLFPDCEKRKQDLKVSEHSRIVNERSVEEVYRRTLAHECGIVACTLEFQLPIWSPSYLNWTTQYRSDENHAIADGFLELVPTPIAHSTEEKPPPLPEVYSQVVEDFPVLAAWEFKSLRVGSIEVFKAILELARQGDFPWQGCDAGSSAICALQHASHTRVPLRTWSKMGPDARQSVFRSAQFPPGDEPIPPLPSDKLTDTHMTHAIYMVQQGYAEMIKHDTTLGCLNAGNYEIYFRRDRAQSAIYITDIILSKSPGRARALVGFFIAAIRDAKERSCQLRRACSPVKTWSAINPYENLHVISILHPEDILAEALTRPFLNLVPDEKRIPASSFLSNSPYRRISPAGLAKIQDTDLSDVFVEITVPPQAHTSKGILKISGNTFDGIPGRLSRFVVVKTANQRRINQRLEREHQVYLDLAAAAVTCIPDVIGLFSHPESEASPHIKLHYLALVLEDVGKRSLADIWQQEGKIPQKLLSECQEALKQIHAADYCYGPEFSLHDIIVREEGLRRDDRSSVSFVSFGGAHKVTEEWWWKDAELQRLVRFLQNPRKHSLRDEDLVDHSNSEHVALANGNKVCQARANSNLRGRDITRSRSSTTIARAGTSRRGKSRRKSRSVGAAGKGMRRS